MGRKSALDDGDDQFRKRESVRLTQRGRPKGIRKVDVETLLSSLHARAVEAAGHYRASVRAARKNGQFQGVASPDDLPPALRKDWDAAQDAWNLYWATCRAKERPLLPPGSNRFRTTLRFRDSIYRVDTGLSRQCKELIDTWQRLVAGQPISGGDDLTVIQVGVVNEFGELFDPPADGSHAALAKRFKKPATTIQSFLRRYRKLKSLRSVK